VLDGATITLGQMVKHMRAAKSIAFTAIVVGTLYLQLAPTSNACWPARSSIVPLLADI
jgi:hypothetical protein